MTPAPDADEVGRPKDGSAEVLVIAAWGGAAGFRARATYATARGGDRTSLAFSESDAVLAFVAHWLVTVEEGAITPAAALDPTAGPSPPP